MKSFQFSLERVLGWRQTQQTMAEAALARLLVEHRNTEQARVDLRTRRVTAQLTIAKSPETVGVELERLDRLGVWSNREDRRLATRLIELQKGIAEQKRVVAEAARNVKMLERLRSRRHAEWKAEMEHELETLTGEWAVTQWRRQQATDE